MLNINAVFGDNDNQVNGDILVHKTSRVIYEADNKLNHYFPVGVAGSDAPADFSHLPLARAQASAFILINADRIHEADNSIDYNNAVTLAYYRLLCMKYRLTSPRYDPAVYHVGYNQAVALGGDVNRVADINQDDNSGIPQARKHLISAAIINILTAARRQEINTIFCNTVCLLAHMFRTRGHHYFPDMVPKLARLWSKTITHNIAIGTSWELLFTVGFHAIIPLILDNFWAHCVNRNLTDDILKLRFNCQSAGTAAFQAIFTGMEDLFAVVPQIEARVHDSAAYIRNTVQHLSEHRWDHSINARFYAANVARLDESHIGVIAALIRATLDSIAANSPLLGSQAMGRCAQNAPISGGAFSIAIRNLLKSEKFLALDNN